MAKIGGTWSSSLFEDTYNYQNPLKLAEVLEGLERVFPLDDSIDLEVCKEAFKEMARHYE
ncbi:hypothetical protein [Helicobacter bizzozeronii]|uniref:Uncharacterized protein n=1 Tax=Helicobacter bizzozeronii (strain CIII-1) TaxID=1002804 RepID=F8KT41_HELBC|nr:hypothetical protein [Helicobacter bizzozeronii]CCB79986.1 hypothetical protein HBZC1_10000 [Helicobacter bizzozeronii CIII-1]